MTNQPSRLIWLRQAGALLLAGLVVCGSPTKSEAALRQSAIVGAVYTRAIAVRPIVFDSQNESRIVMGVPNVGVPKTTINDISFVADNMVRFIDGSMHLTGGILIDEGNWMERPKSSADFVQHGEMNGIFVEACGRLAMVPHFNLEVSFPIDNFDLASPCKISTIDLPSGSFAAYYETIGDVSQKGGSERCDNSVVFVSTDGLTLDEELDLAGECLLYLLASLSCLIVGTALLKGRRS
jgi:hypothetical protein